MLSFNATHMTKIYGFSEREASYDETLTVSGDCNNRVINVFSKECIPVNQPSGTNENYYDNMVGVDQARIENSEPWNMNQGDTGKLFLSNHVTKEYWLWGRFKVLVMYGPYNGKYNVILDKIDKIHTTPTKKYKVDEPRTEYRAAESKINHEERWWFPKLSGKMESDDSESDLLEDL